MITEFLPKKKKKKFWFEINQDAEGYVQGDNRIMNINRREVVRRTYNF